MRKVAGCVMAGVMAALLAGAAAEKLPAIDTNGRTQADYDAHMAKLKKELPAGFTVVQETPFVVVGDGRAADVKMYSERTVAWAVKLLKKEYFEKDPADLITVYLFKDEKSYEKYTKEFFDDKPTTPYGYYSPTDKALIMNISTGGGTLVHEIVHPFVAANFPKCPAWFNEGLGSLYEQCEQVDGRIRGKTNWRLAGLQKAIKEAAGAGKQVPTFEKMCGTTTEEFYTKDRGTNYGQARYLCYYLQEQGLLQAYYKAFVKNAEKDPTGYATLKEILGEKDMAKFQKKWEAWVLELTYP